MSRERENMEGYKKFIREGDTEGVMAGGGEHVTGKY